MLLFQNQASKKPNETWKFENLKSIHVHVNSPYNFKLNSISTSEHKYWWVYYVQTEKGSLRLPRLQNKVPQTRKYIFFCRSYRLGEFSSRRNRWVSRNQPHQRDPLKLWTCNMVCSEYLSTFLCTFSYTRRSTGIADRRKQTI